MSCSLEINQSTWPAERSLHFLLGWAIGQASQLPANSFRTTNNNTKDKTKLLLDDILSLRRRRRVS